MSRRLRCVWPGWLLLAIGSLAAAGAALAQAELVAKPELSAEERAQKQADKVLTFIKLLSAKPQPKRAAAEAVPAQTAIPVQAKVLPKPLPKVAGAAAVPAEARQPALAEVDSQRLPDAAAPATLLAAASLSAAAVQPELLPPPTPPQAEPEPPVLKLLSKVEPEIPRQLQADFKGGAVTVRFMVQTDGSVTQAQALQSSHKRLSLAAVTAVNQWRFAPLAVPREATVDIAFAIE
jgi:TonB family protein